MTAKSILLVVITILFLNDHVVYGQEEIIQFKTEGLTHNTGPAGYFHFDLDNEDFVTRNGDTQLYTNGFTGSVFFTGETLVGNIISSGVTYNLDQNDYTKGILDDNGEVIEGSEQFYSKTWLVHEYQIIQLKEDFVNGELNLSSIPEDVITWPARGNPYVESEFVPFDLAPFHDENGDGEYDPMLGDYPIADQSNESLQASSFTFSAYHDNGTKNYSQSEPGQIQYLQTQYVINCSFSDLTRTVFTNLRMINRSPMSYLNSKVGVYIDVDLGCFEDDFVGVDTSTNSLYVYNADGVDGEICQGQLSPVPNSIASVVSFVFKNPLLSVVPFNTNSSITDLPFNDFEIRNVLSGTFKDGTPMTFGGSALNPASTDNVFFPFTDFPNDSNGWSQQTADLPEQDTRIMASVDLGDFLPGEIKKLEFRKTAVVWDTPVGLEAFQTYTERIENLNEAHEDKLNGVSLSDCPAIAICENDCVWPGDVNLNGKVEVSDVVFLKACEYINNEGPKRPLVSSEWYAHEGINWTQNFDNINLKHADVNGNGAINSLDVPSLESNIGLENGTYLPSIREAENDSNGLTMSFTDNEVEQGGSILNRIARADIRVGEESGIINSDLIALSFDITWDTTLFGLSLFFFNIDGPTFDLGKAYATIGNELIDDPSQEFINASRISVYKSAINLDPISEGGLLGNFGWELKQTAATNNEDGRDTTYLVFQNITALDGEGNIIDLGVQGEYPIFMSNLEIDPTLSSSILKEEKLKIYPNPVSSDQIDFSQKVSEYSIYNLSGQLIKSENSLIATSRINIDYLDQGFYIIKGKTSSNISFTEKIMIARN